MKIISGSSNPKLAQHIAAHLGLELAEVDLNTFANGERRVWVKDLVRGQNVAIVQSLSAPADAQMMELLLLIDAVERAGARHVNVVMPWMGYSLQDKVFRDGEPIAAKVVANLISNSHVKRAFLLDLHNTSTPGFFSIPTQHLSALDVFVEYIQEHFPQLHRDDCIVASPDFGGLKRSRQLAERLSLELINIDKQRDLHTGKIIEMGLGEGNEVQGKTVFVFDDVINSGSTVVNAAETLKKNGAKAVHFFATHGLFANKGYERIEKSTIDTVVITNSIAQELSPKVKVLDISKIFAEALADWMAR